MLKTGQSVLPAFLSGIIAVYSVGNSINVPCYNDLKGPQLLWLIIHCQVVTSIQAVGLGDTQQ